MENNQLKFTKAKFFIILFLVLIGIGLSAELAYIFYKTNFLAEYTQSFCSVSDLIDCDGVAKTNYALTLGVPNAIWGLILYLVILMLLFVDRIQSKFKNSIFNVFENPRSYIASIGFISFLLSMVLAFISIFEIHKICVLCFCVYFINLFIAITAVEKDFFITDIKITINDFIKGMKKHFILFIIVVIAFVSLLTYFIKARTFYSKVNNYDSMQEYINMKKNKYAIKGNVLGKKDAKVVVNVFSDFNCPFCKVTNIMVHKLAKEKNIIVNEISFPLDTSCNARIKNTLGGHESSCIYSRYALAAKNQGKFWGAANILFDKHPKDIKEIEKEFSRIGIDINQLNSDVNSPKIEQELQNDIEHTYSKGILGTPAFEIDGVLYMGALPYEELSDKVDLAIKRHAIDE